MTCRRTQRALTITGAMLAIVPSPGCHDEAAAPNEPRLLTTVALADSALTLGEPIVVSIHVQNVGSVVFSTEHDEGHRTWVEVRNDKRECVLGCFRVSPLPPRRVPLQLAPGESFTDVHRFMTTPDDSIGPQYLAPGHYRVRGRLEDYNASRPWSEAPLALIPIHHR